MWVLYPLCGVLTLFLSVVLLAYHEMTDNAQKILDNNLHAIEFSFTQANHVIDLAQPLSVLPCDKKLKKSLSNILEYNTSVKVVSFIDIYGKQCSSENQDNAFFHLENLYFLTGKSAIYYTNDYMVYSKRVNNSLFFVAQDLSAMVSQSAASVSYFPVKVFYLNNVVVKASGNQDDKHLLNISVYSVSDKFPISLKFSAGYSDFYSYVRTHYVVPFEIIIISMVFLLLAVVCDALYQCHFRVSMLDLQHALSTGVIRPYFQVIMDMETHSVYGYEVLARWQHPRKGFIPPDVFIPLLEKQGKIIPFTEYMFQKVAAELIKNQMLLHSDTHIGINVSAEHLNNYKIVDTCAEFLRATRMCQINLMLEITEREKLDNYENASDVIARLHQLNIKLALDDFGTGQSGLSYLNRYKVDFIKIDRAFISPLVEGAERQIVLGTIIDLATKMNIGLIAEGVETAYQGDFLLRAGVNYQQGYFYGKPQPVLQR